MTRTLSPGTHVVIITGEHTGRTGVVTRHTDKIRALDKLLRQNPRFAVHIRAQLEVLPGMVGVLLDAQPGAAALGVRGEERVVLDASYVISRGRLGRQRVGGIALAAAALACAVAWSVHCHWRPGPEPHQAASEYRTP